MFPKKQHSVIPNVPQSGVAGSTLKGQRAGGQVVVPTPVQETSPLLWTPMQSSFWLQNPKFSPKLAERNFETKLVPWFSTRSSCAMKDSGSCIAVSLVPHRSWVLCPHVAFLPPRWEPLRRYHLRSSRDRWRQQRWCLGVGGTSVIEKWILINTSLLLPVGLGTLVNKSRVTCSCVHVSTSVFCVLECSDSKV